MHSELQLSEASPLHYCIVMGRGGILELKTFTLTMQLQCILIGYDFSVAIFISSCAQPLQIPTMRLSWLLGTSFFGWKKGKQNKKNLLLNTFVKETLEVELHQRGSSKLSVAVKI